MKKSGYIFFIFFILLLLTDLKSIAQQDKIEVLRTNYIGKKLDLNASESEKFWPVYNEMNDKLKALKKNLRIAYKKLPPEPTEKEAEELISLELKTREAENEVLKTYYEKIKSIIGVKKLAKLQLYEEEFKKEIINTLKEK